MLNAANDIHGADGDDRFKILRVNAVEAIGAVGGVSIHLRARCTESGRDMFVEVAAAAAAV